MGGPGGGGGGYATTGSIGATAGSGGDAVDECGLRFLLAMRHHTCLMRSLPPKHRAILEEKVSAYIVSQDPGTRFKNPSQVKIQYLR